MDKKDLDLLARDIAGIAAPGVSEEQARRDIERFETEPCVELTERDVYYVAFGSPSETNAQNDFLVISAFSPNHTFGESLGRIQVTRRQWEALKGLADRFFENVRPPAVWTH